MSRQSHQQFQFKQFLVKQDRCAMKVGTDGVLLGAWAEGGQRVLDIGTGTGLIALMMAQRFPEAVIDAIDIDLDAVEQARENVFASPFADRITVVNCALQDYVPAHLHTVFPVEDDVRQMGVYDAIVCNPPFFVDSLKNPDKKRAIARHTDSLPFRLLMKRVASLLTADGICSLVLPVEVKYVVEDEALIYGLSKVKEVYIKTKLNKLAKRCLVAFSHTRTTGCQTENVCLMDCDNGRSEWYQNLTKEFYL